jgi:opacity protein-like surface antigen
MHYIFGSHLNKRLSLTVIVLISICLIPGPALANALGSQLEVTLVPAASIAVMALGGYMLYQNRWTIPPDVKWKLGYKGPGEFYYGGFLGVSFVSTADWFMNPLTINNFTQQTALVSVRNVKTDPGPVFGVKVGYFFDTIPYLGLEGEGSIASNNRPRQQVTMKPPVFPNPSFTEQQGSLFWTMALHIVGRYGFLQDQEVPFGRLQPYVGIGPGLGCLYFQNDSAKNFGLDMEVGVRYYFTKNIVALLEFKYVKQWADEMETQHIISGGNRFTADNAPPPNEKATHFNFDNQKIVCGLEYHF